MSEQNPSEPLEMTVLGDSNPDQWWKTGGALRMGHWVVVTVYRFTNVRNPASPGGALPLSGKGDNSAREYGVAGMFNRQVFTFKAANSPFEPGEWDEPQFVGPIKSVRTSKRLGAGSGTFTIMTKPFAEWAPLTPEQSVESEVDGLRDPSIAKYVDSGDWVEIVVYKADPRIKSTSGRLRTLLVGKVDSVHLNIAPIGGGGTGSVVRIEGRDIGAVYEDTVIYFNPYDPLHSNAEGKDMAKMVTDVSGTPGDIVLQMLGLVKNKSATFGLQAQTPDAGLWTPNPFSLPILFSETVVEVQGDTRGTVFDPAILSPGQATPLWDFVNTYGVPELNEVWVDTLPNEAGPQWDGEKRYSYVQVREKPFVNLTDGEKSPWFFISDRIVHIGEIKSANLSRGDNRYNYINVLIELPANFSYDAFALCQPIFDKVSITKHGLLKLDMTLALNMIADGETDSLVVSQQIRALRDLVLCWNLLNPYYYNGTIVLVGIRADIRVGTRIVVEGGPVPNMQYGPFTGEEPGYDRYRPGAAQGPFTAYVEQVEYNWAAGDRPEATTTISISRGYRDDLRLSHMRTLALGWSEVISSASAISTSNTVYTGETGDGRPE